MAANAPGWERALSGSGASAARLRELWRRPPRVCCSLSRWPVAGGRRTGGRAGGRGRRLSDCQFGVFELDLAAIHDATSVRSSGVLGRGVMTVAICATVGLLAAGCSGGRTQAAGHGGGHASVGASSGAAASGVRLSITPAGGGAVTAPNRGITVRAEGGRISKVVVRTRGDRVTGRLNAAGTVWRSSWALNVSRRYTVTATAVDISGRRVTRWSSFRTFTPKRTFSTRIIEGYRQTYGVGMPIILYFSRPISDKAAVERALRDQDLEAGRGRLVLGQPVQPRAGLPVFPAAPLLAAAHPGELHRPPERGGGRPRASTATTPSPRGSRSARSLIVVASTAATT